MITYLQGGLGNQMFQYAAGLGVAERLQEPLFIDDSFYKNHKQRQYQLNNFPISGKMATCTSMPIFESGFPYQEISRSGTMVGYWQSEKYFEHIADKIRQEFKLPKHDIDSDMVAVSVRRGDYLALGEVFANLDEEYYGDAREVFPDATFVVFSDDPEWCEQNLEWADVVVKGNSDIVDLALLASFKNHIIANSSFAWWGAWLADGDTVVAPREWFTNGLDTTDLIPDRWIRI